jgi:diaminohydroxyphosphoribosylaminopyrimidine deaminase/5-amino-6-(5-phosphoribosylamino)uracil reductase
VGTQTVIDDNPKLDVRDWTGGNPVRIVLTKKVAYKKADVFDNQTKLLFYSKDNYIQQKIFTIIDFEKNIATQVTDACMTIKSNQ